MNSEKPNTRSRSVLISGAVIVVLVVVAIFGIELARRSGGGANSPTLPPNTTQTFPRELTDGQGEKLVIPAKPKRIVSQTLGTDEILLTICPAEQVVALSNLADNPNNSNVIDLAKAVPGRTISGPEQIIQMQPDLIFVASYSRAETVQILKASKAPVFRFFNFTSFEDVKQNIRTVGYAAGCDEKAEKLVQSMDDELAELHGRIPAGSPPPRVMSFNDPYTAGSNTTFNDLVRAVGAVNVSAENGIDGFAKISAEKVAEWQPDYIVVGANYDELESKKAQLLADPIIASTKAGKEGKVITIDNRHYLSVSQFTVNAAQDLFTGLYGNRSAK